MDYFSVVLTDDTWQYTRHCHSYAVVSPSSWNKPPDMNVPIISTPSYICFGSSTSSTTFSLMSPSPTKSWFSISSNPPPPAEQQEIESVGVTDCGAWWTVWIRHTGLISCLFTYQHHHHQDHRTSRATPVDCGYVCAVRVTSCPCRVAHHGKGLLIKKSDSVCVCV